MSVLIALTAALLTIGIVPAWFGIPQVGGLRFLPLLLTVAALVFQPPERRLSILPISALLLASFWSIEAFIWSFLTVVCSVGGWVPYERRWIREFLRSVGKAAITVAGAHAIFSITAYITLGRWPRRFRPLGGACERI